MPTTIIIDAQLDYLYLKWIGQTGQEAYTFIKQCYGEDVLGWLKNIISKGDLINES